MRELTDFQKRCAAILLPDGNYHYAVASYELASKVYADRWESNPWGRACLMGTVQRSLARRPAVFVDFIAGGNPRSPGPRMFALSQEYRKWLAGQGGR